MAQGPQSPAPVRFLEKKAREQILCHLSTAWQHGFRSARKKDFFSNMGKDKHCNYRPQAALLQQVLTPVRMQLAEAATCPNAYGLAAVAHAERAKPKHSE